LSRSLSSRLGFQARNMLLCDQTAITTQARCLEEYVPSSCCEPKSPDSHCQRLVAPGFYPVKSVTLFPSRRTPVLYSYLAANGWKSTLIGFLLFQVSGHSVQSSRSAHCRAPNLLRDLATSSSHYMQREFSLEPCASGLRIQRLIDYCGYETASFDGRRRRSPLCAWSSWKISTRHFLYCTG